MSCNTSLGRVCPQMRGSRGEEQHGRATLGYSGERRKCATQVRRRTPRVWAQRGADVLKPDVSRMGRWTSVRREATEAPFRSSSLVATSSGPAAKRFGIHLTFALEFHEFSLEFSEHSRWNSRDFHVGILGTFANLEWEFSSWNSTFSSLNSECRQLVYSGRGGPHS